MTRVGGAVMTSPPRVRVGLGVQSRRHRSQHRPPAMIDRPSRVRTPRRRTSMSFGEISTASSGACSAVQSRVGEAVREGLSMVAALVVVAADFSLT